MRCRSTGAHKRGKKGFNYPKELLAAVPALEVSPCSYVRMPVLVVCVRVCVRVRVCWEERTKWIVVAHSGAYPPPRWSKSRSWRGPQDIQQCHGVLQLCPGDGRGWGRQRTHETSPRAAVACPSADAAELAWSVTKHRGTGEELEDRRWRWRGCPTAEPKHQERTSHCDCSAEETQTTLAICPVHPEDKEREQEGRGKTSACVTGEGGFVYVLVCMRQAGLLSRFSGWFKPKVKEAHLEQDYTFEFRDGKYVFVVSGGSADVCWVWRRC